MFEEPTRRHVPKTMESSKFEFRRASYLDYPAVLPDLEYEMADYLPYFPCFVGSMTLSRILTLTDHFRETSRVNGHIADVEIFRGASSFLFAKLLEIYEPNSLSRAHGFDWFQGNQPSSGAGSVIPGGGIEDEYRLRELARLQGLEHVLHIRSIDLVSQIQNFFDRFERLRFRLIFMDAGMHEVVRSALPYFWDHLNPGVPISFDQYNFDAAPGETRAVNEFFASKDVEFLTIQGSWMPTMHVQKGGLAS